MQTNCISRFHRLLGAALILLFLSPLSAQKAMELDKQPEFPGGTSALMTFLGQNIKYPEGARKENAEGMVLVKFVVGTDGSIGSIQTVGNGKQNLREDFVKETVRVVKSMPRWVPGEAGGKKVKAEVTLPVKYKLDGGKKQ